MTEKEFWANVRKEKGCWLWQGLIYDGYGRVQWKGKSYWAHRLAFSLTKGEIPKKIQTDHICRNRSCINPEHLELVTQKENVLRGVSFSAINARKTHCPKGHKFDENNTYSPPGRFQRKCRECTRMRQIKAYHIKKTK